MENASNDKKSLCKIPLKIRTYFNGWWHLSRRKPRQGNIGCSTQRSDYRRIRKRGWDVLKRNWRESWSNNHVGYYSVWWKVSTSTTLGKGWTCQGFIKRDLQNHFIFKTHFKNFRSIRKGKFGYILSVIRLLCERFLCSCLDMITRTSDKNWE